MIDRFSVKFTYYTIYLYIYVDYRFQLTVTEWFPPTYPLKMEGNSIKYKRIGTVNQINKSNDIVTLSREITD